MVESDRIVKKSTVPGANAQLARTRTEQLHRAPAAAAVAVTFAETLSIKPRLYDGAFFANRNSGPLAMRSAISSAWHLSLMRRVPTKPSLL